MAASPLDDLFVSAFAMQRPLVVPTGPSNGGDAYAPTRLNSIATQAPLTTPYGVPLMTYSQIKAGGVWTLPNPYATAADGSVLVNQYGDVQQPQSNALNCNRPVLTYSFDGKSAPAAPANISSAVWDAIQPRRGAFAFEYS